MQITVFGANGRVGSLIVQMALQEGHNVTAFVHGNSNLQANKKLQLFQGDIYNSEDVQKALSGSEVIISALGSWGTPNKDVLTTGMTHIISAMQQHSIKRIISLTGADAIAYGDSVSIAQKVTHTFLGLFAGKILTDGEQHIELLQKSNLYWTVVRSPVMNEKGDPTQFMLVAKKPSILSTIHRQSVARCMVNLIQDTTYLKKLPYIRR